jgi:hypothetical protein
MKRAVFITASIFLLAFAIDPAFAGSKKKKASSTPKYQPPVISSVIGNTVTVTERKMTRAFIVTQFTEISVNGQRATVADLKPGMTVNVTIGLDPSQAGRITATGAPASDRRKQKK